MPERIPAEMARETERETVKTVKISSIILGLLLLTPIILAQSRQSAKWKAYEADNGAKFEVNMNTVRVIRGLGVLVYAGWHGEDIVANPYIFDCHGHFEIMDDDNNPEESGPTMSGWLLAPPYSVAGAVAKDICAKR